MTDRYQPPLREMVLATDEQMKAFANPTRRDILALLSERPASVKELSIALGKAKGSVGHHVKALESAGMVRVVRTRQVRAITEKFYGRTARTFALAPGPDVPDDVNFIEQLRAEIRPASEGQTLWITLRHARLAEARLEEFSDRLLALAEEFAAAPRSGTTVYGMVAGLYPTERPSLPTRQEPSP